MSDSVRPHRRQPSRFARPWDSPGKNTGVGCHFLLQCMKVKSESEVAQSCPHGLQPTRLLCPWDFPGKSTRVGCHCLLLHLVIILGFPGDSVVKNLPANTGNSREVGLIPGWGRSPGGGNSHPFQYSCESTKIPWAEEPGGLQSMESQKSRI